MIRETITIALLMFSSAAFGRAACLPCDPTQVRYALGHRDDLPGMQVESLKEVVESAWYKQGNPSAKYCGPSAGRHQALVGPSGDCANASVIDFSSFSRQGCPPTVAVPRTHNEISVHVNDGINHVLNYNNELAAAGKKGGFGLGWSDLYGRQIEWNETEPGVAYAHRHDGSRVRFEAGNGRWVAKEGSETLAELWEGNTWTGWIYKNKSGVEEWYDTSLPRSRLQWLWNYADIQQSIYHMPEGIGVGDVWGRWLMMHKNAAGLIIQVDTTQGNAIRYHYHQDYLYAASFPTGATLWWGYGDGAGGGWWSTGRSNNTTDLTSTWNGETLLAAYDMVGPVQQGDGYIVQANEKVAGLFGLRIPRPIGAPPVTGTRGATQPPYGHSLPVPPGMERSRPLERFDRHGQPLTYDDNAESSSEWRQKCVQAAMKCLNKLAPGVPIQDIADMVETALKDGQCPIPDGVTDRALMCIESLSVCLELPKSPSVKEVIFPDGTVVKK